MQSKSNWMREYKYEIENRDKDWPELEQGVLTAEAILLRAPPENFKWGEVYDVKWNIQSEMDIDSTVDRGAIHGWDNYHFDKKNLLKQALPLPISSLFAHCKGCQRPPGTKVSRVENNHHKGETNLISPTSPSIRLTALGRITRERRREGWSEGLGLGRERLNSALPSSKSTLPALPIVSSSTWRVKASVRSSGLDWGPHVNPAAKTHAGKALARGARAGVLLVKW